MLYMQPRATVAFVGVATLNLALPAPPVHIRKEKPALNRDKGLDLDPVWDPVLIN